MTELDSTVVQRYSEHLLERAAGIVTRWTVVGSVVGAIAGGVQLTTWANWPVPHREAYLVVVLGAFAGGFLGHAFGSRRATGLRLQAQLAQHQFAFERSTLAAQAALAPTPPAAPQLAPPPAAPPVSAPTPATAAAPAPPPASAPAPPPAPAPVAPVAAPTPPPAPPVLPDLPPAPAPPVPHYQAPPAQTPPTSPAPVEVPHVHLVPSTPAPAQPAPPPAAAYLPGPFGT